MSPATFVRAPGLSSNRSPKQPRPSPSKTHRENSCVTRLNLDIYRYIFNPVVGSAAHFQISVCTREQSDVGRRNRVDIFFAGCLLSFHVRKRLGNGLGSKASGTAGQLGGIQVGLNDIRLDGLHWVTLASDDMFHQTPGSFVDVDVFLQV